MPTITTVGLNQSDLSFDWCFLVRFDGVLVIDLSLAVATIENLSQFWAPVTVSIDGSLEPATLSDGSFKGVES